MLICKLQRILMIAQSSVGIAQTPAGSALSHPVVKFLSNL
jgi:hypothetical protein